MLPPNNSFPVVSIVTVNYNGTDVTRALLNSLKEVTYPSVEVIVVDNGSKVPCEVLKNEFPGIKYLDTQANLGFAGGNNRGIEISTGKYILLLNNDTEVAPGFLEPLVSRMENDPSIGIVCPMLLYFDEPDTIQFAGFSPINTITGRGFTIGAFEKDNGQYNEAKPISRGHGAAMMFSREAMQQVGMMAEVFFLYYEEMDYCERFKKKGYTIWYEPSSKVWHKESMATGKGSVLKTYYYSRNRLLYLRRNTPSSKQWMMYLYYYLVAVPKNIFTLLVKKQTDHLTAFWKGLTWNWANAKTDKYDL